MDKYTIETRNSNEPSLGSQPSIQGLENHEEIGGNVEVTNESNISVI